MLFIWCDSEEYDCDAHIKNIVQLLNAIHICKNCISKFTAMKIPI